MGHGDLEISFPSLRLGSYRITSPATPAYNCVAWAVGDTERWWDPSRADGYFWPRDVSHVLSVTNLVNMFATLGYRSCGNADLEPGFDKVAIYADEFGSPTHVARQLPTGAWTSKLGVTEDVEHDSLARLEGFLYGKVVHVLRSQRAAPR